MDELSLDVSEIGFVRFLLAVQMRRFMEGATGEFP